MGEGGCGLQPVGIVSGGDQELGGRLGADTDQLDQTRGCLRDQGVEFGVGLGYLLGEVLVSASRTPRRGPDRAGWVGEVSVGAETGKLRDQLVGGQAAQAFAHLGGGGDDEGANLVDRLGADLMAERRTTRRDRMASTMPSRVFGRPLARPDRTAVAAA
ncbi:hypothetical protein ABT147_45045 [Streptomyces sp. NPDC001868]|uniref:hypothetical protein n=1 Tax=Streptomyces sp. NPDC001868 TaxID=3154401 RepID=UPI00332773E3